MSDPIVIDLKGCPRCGGDHPGQPFAALLNPEGLHNLFTICPGTSQPVLRASAAHEPGADPALVMEVVDCHRCGGRHARLEFHRLQRPSSDFHYWALCPETHEPLVAKVGGGAHGHHRAMSARPLHPDAGAGLAVPNPEVVRDNNTPARYADPAPGPGAEGGEG